MSVCSDGEQARWVNRLQCVRLLLLRYISATPRADERAALLECVPPRHGPRCCYSKETSHAWQAIPAEPVQIPELVVPLCNAAATGFIWKNHWCCFRLRVQRRERRVVEEHWLCMHRDYEWGGHNWKKYNKQRFQFLCFYFLLESWLYHFLATSKQKRETE